MDTQVVIAGAGPVGLFLAGELRLAGISVLVLDPLAQRSPHSKGLIIHPRTPITRITWPVRIAPHRGDLVALEGAQPYESPSLER